MFAASEMLKDPLDDPRLSDEGHDFEFSSAWTEKRVELEHSTNQVSPSPTKSLPLGGARGFLVVFREGVRSVR